MIREFTIKNLAGRSGSTSIKFDPHVNLIWGLNGTGKTTVLRILNAALSNSTEGLVKLPFDEATVVFYSHYRKINITRSLVRKHINNEAYKTGQTFIDLDSLDDTEYEDVTSNESISGHWITTHDGDPVSDRDYVNKEFMHDYLPISRMLDVARDSRTINADSFDSQFEEQVRQVWIQYSRRSLSEIRDIQQRGLAEVLSILFGGTSEPDPGIPELSTLGGEYATTTHEAYNIVSDFLKRQRIQFPLGLDDFSRQYEASTSSQEVVTKIRSVMNRVDAVMEPQRELELIIGEMYTGTKELVLPRRSSLREQIGVKIGDEIIAISSLSSGEKQLLYMLIATLAVDFSTIMIDEPELSLHPDWQEGLVESMRRINPRAQLILATHSPELMVRVDEKCVFEL